MTFRADGIPPHRLMADYAGPVQGFEGIMGWHHFDVEHRRQRGSR